MGRIVSDAMSADIYEQERLVRSSAGDDLKAEAEAKAKAKDDKIKADAIAAIKDRFELFAKLFDAVKSADNTLAAVIDKHNKGWADKNAT